MRNVSPPRSGGRARASVAACLASILELDVAEVPLPDDAHPEPFKVWRNWLAQRRLGLVPIADPASFSWPGPWLALLRPADGGERIGAVAFGAPPGLAWSPLGGSETFDAVEVGYLVAPADVSLWSARDGAAPRLEGTVEAILVAGDAEAPMRPVTRAVARAGRGLEGDRYFDQRGTFSDAYDRGHDLTLVEQEVLDELRLPTGPITAADARRNIVTRGIDLNALVGRRFTVGGVECFGERLCEPCAHLERVNLRPGSLRAMVHRGGLRADLVSDGEIRVGDAIAAVIG